MLRVRQGAIGGRAGQIAQYLADAAIPPTERDRIAYLTRSVSDQPIDPLIRAADALSDMVQAGDMTYGEAEATLADALVKAAEGDRAWNPVHQIWTLPPEAARTGTQRHVSEAEAAVFEARAADAIAAALDRRDDGRAIPSDGIALPWRGMAPDIARTLAVDPARPVSADELANLLAGRAANGTDLPLPNRDIAYTQLIFSAPKKVSVAYALAETPEDRAVFLQAHRNAVDAAFDAMLDDLGVTRRGKGGVIPVPVHIAAFDVEHIASRPVVEVAGPSGQGTELRPLPVKGDMQLHTHRIVPNVGIDAQGRVGAINRNAIAGRVHEYGAIYQAALASELRRAGVRVRRREDHVDLPDIPDAVAHHFSKRDRSARFAAQEWARVQGLDWESLTPQGRLALIDSASAIQRGEKAGDRGDFDAWRQQAAELGYQHRSPVRPGVSWTPEAGRLDRAYERSLPLLEKELQGQSIISASTIRAVAARGLIDAGMDDWRDVSAVTRRFREWGVQQDGQRTTLDWRRDGEGSVFVFTRLSRQQERLFVALARDGAKDRGASLPQGDATARAVALGLDLSGPHGRAQARAMEALATGGRVAVAFGAAGSGKSTMLRPVVSGYQERGWTVFGISLANRQANELTDAGIDKGNIMAVHPFLARLRDGKVAPDARSVVVVDEVALLGTRQGLELLEARKRLGFKLVAVGGPEQSQSIEAGSVTDLFVRALGKDAIPNIETSVRQQDAEERRIADLFRTGKTLEALAAKHRRGDLEFVPGGREETIERAAAEYARIRAENPGASVAIGTTSHEDAHAIGAAVRATLGIGPALVTIRAQQGDGITRDMPLAAGDRVRLYDRIWGKTPDGKSVHVGDNGHIVEVVKANAEGVQFRTKRGELAGVRWEGLQRDGSPVRLSYGYAQTTIIVQGATEDHYIAALPGGTAPLSGNAAYVHGSRHRHSARFLISDGQERRNLIGKRPVGAVGAIGTDDLLRNAAENLGKPGDKETVHRFLSRIQGIERSAARDFTHAVRHSAPIREPQPEAVKRAAQHIRHRQMDRSMSRAIPALPQRQQHRGPRLSH